MIELQLKSEPAYYDEYSQPCYPSAQEKGLSEFQDNQLLKGALGEGYTATVASILHRLIIGEIRNAGVGRKVDLIEIGGGNGHFFDLVEEDVSTYVNIEPGHVHLNQKGIERLRNLKYQCLRCSAEDIPLYDESVDVAISIASFDHIPHYRKAMAEISRVLRKDGVFILALNNRRSWWKILLSGTDYLKRREAAIAEEHYFQWSLAECKSHLSEFMPVIKIYSTTFLPYVPRLWRYLLPGLDFLGKHVGPRYGANTIAVCRKSGSLLT